MRRIHLMGIILVSLFLLPSGVQALAFFSGDRVIISEPVNDDIFASGGMVVINAPVTSVIAAGGTVAVNAPVRGDVIAAGGSVSVNGSIGGKVVAAGGTITIDGPVGTNAVLAGGEVRTGSGAVIARDVVVSANRYSNEGTIGGTAMVSAGTFENSGKAGSIDTRQNGAGGTSLVVKFLPVLFAIGWLILGLVLVRFLPAHASRLADEAGKSPVLRTVLGFIVLVLSVIVLIILALSIVGMPFAISGVALLVLGIIIGPLVVSFRFGRLVAGLFQKTFPDWAALITGFIIIAVLVWIPVIGIIVLFVVIALGLGTIVHVSRAYCPFGTAGNSGGP